MTSSIQAISPVDGRYEKVARPLSAYFSEYALIRYRVEVEVKYFIALCEIPLPQLNGVSEDQLHKLSKILETFSVEDAEEIKAIEKETNHDVKAVEYFIKSKFDQFGLEDYREFVHFGLTSQDINNTAIPLQFKDALGDCFMPLLHEVHELLGQYAKQWETIPMLSRTHGQPASPTRLGKEMMVFYERIAQQIELMKTIPFSAKFGGATGNMNAHLVSYPEIDWNAFANSFIEGLGLKRSYPTTQIEHYDHLAAAFDNLKRINTVLIDFSRDVWQYVAMDYFKQRIQANEVGSSAMPHKVNPIDFENAEGNLSYANAIFEYLAAKLPISRLQRDLTDSTVLRNIGMPVAHTYIALNSLVKGMKKLELNGNKIQQDLQDNWAVVAEAIQTILRREGYPSPYEALKQLTRTNQKIDGEIIAAFIDGLEIGEQVKAELKSITPENYTGILG